LANIEISVKFPVMFSKRSGWIPTLISNDFHHSCPLQTLCWHWQISIAGDASIQTFNSMDYEFCSRTQWTVREAGLAKVVSYNVSTHTSLQQSSIAYPGQRKCIQYPYRDVGWWKRGNPVISPYSAFYYWSRTSCVIWRRSDTICLTMCLVRQCSHISGTQKAYVSPALSPYCLRYVLLLLRVYQHNFTSTHQSVHHSSACGTVATCIPVHLCINTLSPYTSNFTSVHLSYITRLSLSVLAPSACQWLHLYFASIHLMSVHLYICASAILIPSRLISSDKLYGLYSLYS
jgi:hypothetical protein